MPLSTHTEKTIHLLEQKGLTRKEIICLLDDAATNGGISYEINDCEDNPLTINITADGEVTFTTWHLNHFITIINMKKNIFLILSCICTGMTFTNMVIAITEPSPFIFQIAFVSVFITAPLSFIFSYLFFRK